MDMKSVDNLAKLTLKFLTKDSFYAQFGIPFDKCMGSEFTAIVHFANHRIDEFMDQKQQKFEMEANLDPSVGNED